MEKWSEPPLKPKISITLGHNKKCPKAMDRPRTPPFIFRKNLKLNLSFFISPAFYLCALKGRCISKSAIHA